MQDKLKGNELWFLYKKCKRIRPVVISKIQLVDEYMQALREYPGSLNDETVFEIIRDVYNGMCERGESYRTARDVVNKVSRDLYGDPHAWQYK